MFEVVRTAWPFTPAHTSLGELSAIFLERGLASQLREVSSSAAAVSAPFHLREGVGGEEGKGTDGAAPAKQEMQAGDKTSLQPAAQPRSLGFRVQIPKSHWRT